jgi:hypothetical protein
LTPQKEQGGRAYGHESQDGDDEDQIVSELTPTAVGGGLGGLFGLIHRITQRNPD